MAACGAVVVMVGWVSSSFGSVFGGHGACLLVWLAQWFVGGVDSRDGCGFFVLVRWLVKGVVWQFGTAGAAWEFSFCVGVVRVFLGGSAWGHWVVTLDWVWQGGDHHIINASTKKSTTHLVLATLLSRAAPVAGGCVRYG